MLRKHILAMCALAAMLGALLACGHSGDNAAPTAAQRKAVDSVVKTTRGIDSMAQLYARMEKTGNTLGRIVTLREWGKQLRNESKFDQALTQHERGMQLAQAAHDTLEWVQALNNVGTDYRRMGLLDVAQQYHYDALTLSTECSDTSFTAKKNNVVSLNGLANVYLTIQNWQRASALLRMALAGERMLGSDVGQAINYANLGSIFESTGQTDSAWVYYKKSMQLNTQAGNELGIALCHTYFGNLYEKAHDYDNALKEYTQAYELMKQSKDDWHALTSITALASVYYAMGNDGKALQSLAIAQRMAGHIHSIEHLSEIYTLYYKISKRRGNYREALSYHERATAMQDSLIDIEKMNRMQTITLGIERKQQSQRIEKARSQLSRERTMRYVGYAVFITIVLLLTAFILQMLHMRRLRNKSHEALRRLSEMRETFFTNVTHEFRTPLTVILGLGHDLQQPGVTTGEAADMGRAIERQGQGLLTLVNQLLDIAKIKSAIGQPDWVSGDIAAYVNMIVERFASTAAKRGIKLSINSSGAIVTNFVPDYVNKTLSNLLSNAIKFTPQGGAVTVSISQKADVMHLDVADTGCGIPAKSLDSIFEPFYQADNASGTVGTGIGLALVKQIIEAISGQITVDSIEGKGTTFHIAIPIKHDAAKRAFLPDKQQLAHDPNASDAESPHPSELSAGNRQPSKANDDADRPVVLVVEDNADVASYIGKKLNQSYSVLYAANGAQGIEKAREAVPDVIVTDLMMPKLDGLELCKRLRADELTSHIPIIMVTAKATTGERIEGIDAGADAYLTKPFNSEELLVRISKLLEQRALLQRKYASQALASSGDTAKQDGDTTTLLPAKQESQPSITAVEQQFLEKVTEGITAMIQAGADIDVNAVASRLCMSYSQFYRKLKALTGLTPAQYIQRVKIKLAQQLLATQPGITLTEVAERCGFIDYSNFVRSFRNVLGISPSQYAKQAQSHEN